MEKRWQNRVLILLSAVLLSACSGYFGWIAADAVEQTEVSTETISEDTVLVGGMPVGIYMETVISWIICRFSSDMVSSFSRSSE